MLRQPNFHLNGGPVARVHHQPIALRQRSHFLLRLCGPHVLRGCFDTAGALDCSWVDTCRSGVRHDYLQHWRHPLRHVVVPANVRQTAPQEAALKTQVEEEVALKETQKAEETVIGRVQQFVEQLDWHVGPGLQ